jgi:8-oxo-dGTP pyrophosphatase MutT (NUDIX family)
VIDLDRLGGRLAERERLEVVLEGFRASAVLVPIVVEEGAPERLLFIVRDGSLRAHAGQVAFPGGAREAADAGHEACALREAEEEIGIERERVRVIGLLDDIPTPTGYVITPVVGAVPGPLALSPSAGEVAATFAATFDEIADPARHATDGFREWMGARYEMHEYRFGEWRIWGATARILHQLLQLSGRVSA